MGCTFLASCPHPPTRKGAWAPPSPLRGEGF
ncbi:hypothetical protein SPHINGO391_370007 [Sphingomonas aurantiaca]|uniref:Uncharacterized protein n=1 Tax=Sphingomonas aurantiaca TaxID=185949 RepID=A0A5E7YFK1_9SPHN|nr:hypothetical protein SPHINGO391_370007 [Sphingomonas aurantiaca]